MESSRLSQISSSVPLAHRGGRCFTVLVPDLHEASITRGQYFQGLSHGGSLSLSHMPCSEPHRVQLRSELY
jgi:hypothetical protein